MFKWGIFKQLSWLRDTYDRQLKNFFKVHGFFFSFTRSICVHEKKKKKKKKKEKRKKEKKKGKIHVRVSRI